MGAPLFDVVELLGKETTLRRLRRFLERRRRRLRLAAAAGYCYAGLVVLAQLPQVLQRDAQHADHARDFPAVVPHLGVAVGQAVDGLVLLETVLLEGQPLDHLVELGAQHEGDVPHAQESAALRAVDLFAAGVGDAVDHELPLASRALEDFRNHGYRQEVYSRRGRGRAAIFGCRRRRRSP